MLKISIPPFGIFGAKFAPKRCPCGWVAPAADGPRGVGLISELQKPEAGDLQFCMGCEEFQVYRDGAFRPVEAIDLMRKRLPDRMH